MVREQRNNWFGLYLLVGSVWGCSFLFIALSNHFLTPFGVGFWRQTLGGFPLLILSLFQRRKLPTQPRAYWLLFLASLCMNSIPSALFAYAEQHVTSSFAGIMNAATPIATVLVILSVFHEEKPTRKVLFGLGIGLAGVLTVLSIWNGLGNNDPLAVLALVIAVTLYGIGGPFARRYISSLNLDNQVQVAIQVVFASISLAPFYLTGQLATATPSALDLAGLVVLGLVGTGFTYVWYYKLLTVAGSAIANSVTYLSPVVAVLVGSVLLHEAVTWNEIVGGAIVILGAAIGQGRLDPLFARLSARK
jgi:drug/metabolite transporter (DMT)-like permease